MFLYRFRHIRLIFCVLLCFFRRIFLCHSGYIFDLTFHVSTQYSKIWTFFFIKWPTSKLELQREELSGVFQYFPLTRTGTLKRYKTSSTELPSVRSHVSMCHLTLLRTKTWPGFWTWKSPVSSLTLSLWSVTRTLLQSQPVGRRSRTRAAISWTSVNVRLDRVKALQGPSLFTHSDI